MLGALIIIISSVFQFLALTWWFWAFVIFLPIFVSLWLHWRQEMFKNSVKWVLLEIRIPRLVIKSAKAMEQVLMAMHTLRNAPGDLQEKYWEGEVTRWFTLEIVSFGGEVRFFVRAYAKQKDLIEAAFFSYYPDVEVVQVDDYVDKLPQNLSDLYERGLDMWGTEMLLSREDAYPIKTYPFFEEVTEEKTLSARLDPISTFLEVLGKVKKGELVGIQILIAPAGPEWKDKWASLLDGLRERTEDSTPTAFRTAVDFPGGGPLPALSVIGGEDKKSGTDFLRSFSRTPGEIDVLEAVEKNLSKPAFDASIRFIYFSPKSIFYDSFARRGLVGAFNQYAVLNLNSFRQNYQISTRTRFWHWPHLFPDLRNEYKKQRLLSSYLKRGVPPETFMGRLITSHPFNLNFASRRFAMNVEGLATLFHPPTAVVLTTPHIKRVESRKTGPPAGLAIYGEEEEIEKYK